MIVVRDLDHLRAILSDGQRHDFKMLLNFGAFSRKGIAMVGNKFDVLNCIDDTWQTLGPKQIMDSKHTLIGEAIRKGALVYEEE